VIGAGHLDAAGDRDCQFTTQGGAYLGSADPFGQGAATAIAAALAAPLTLERKVLEALKPGGSRAFPVTLPARPLDDCEGTCSQSVSGTGSVVVQRT
jgi:hypothetical protein